ncbi:MAG: beta-propeller fold lactonase family protein [Betaproteobacteria bacterium]|nr:beta-propeller fold lactonase family protein [Betaproteobacteria bacterium]
MTTTAHLYSAVDEEITHYEVDVEAATLTQRGSIRVPSLVQYAWPHPSRRYLYVTTSNRGAGLKADCNHVSACRIDPATGALTAHGEPAPLRQRAVHMCLDHAGNYAVNIHNIPVPGITIHRIDADGTIGAEVKQPDGLDFGIYPHQVRVMSSGCTVVDVDRGNSAAHGKAEDPGALRSFAFDNGVLSSPHVVAPNGGYGFGPRHIDFHPERPWLYVSDERRSQLYMFRYPDDRIEPAAAFTCDMLADRANARPRQLAGAIHVHPNGRFVYVANRADYTVEHEGQKVFGGGENSIAVFAIDPASGEPKLIQHADTRSYHVRTFAFDPSGRLMVAASIKPTKVREGSAVKTVPASLSVFRVRADGKLDHARTYDVESNTRTQYWMGIVGRP